MPFGLSGSGTAKRSDRSCFAASAVKEQSAAGQRPLPAAGRWLCVFVLLSVGWVQAGARDGRLDLYWIDVEGGAATLIVTPGGESVLIDTGNPGFRDPERIVRVVTKVAGLRKIDHLIITHYHGDHFGGAAALSKLLPIGTVYDNGVFAGMPNDPGKDYFDFRCDRRVVVQPGMEIAWRLPPPAATPPCRLAFVGARQQFIRPSADTPENADLCASARSKDRDGSDNANSIVTLLTFGPFRFFDAGDLTWNREQDLVCPRNLVGQVDVYQVTHHGLDSSNNPLVLRSLLPTVAIMNNGAQKGCLPDVFAALRDTPSIEATYQLHKNLRPDGAMNNVAAEYIANQESDKSCRGNHIELSVDPKGAEYVVRIPATGHQRKFVTRATPRS